MALPATCPILGASLRRPAALFAAVNAAVVAGFGMAFGGRGTAGAIDLRLQAVVESVLRRPDLAGTIVPAANPETVVLAAAVLGGVSLTVRRPRMAVLCVLGPGLTGLATTGLQVLFGRTLNGALAYPSGHTAGATALALVAALLWAALSRPASGPTVLGLLTLVIGVGIAMAVALVAQGLHYPTDTVGGICTGLAVVLLVAVLVDRAADRLARRRAGGCGELEPR